MRGKLALPLRTLANVVLAAILSLLAVSPTPAAAATLTYTFEGVVTGFEDVFPFGQIEPRWPIGTRISGSYRFFDGLQDDVNPIAQADPNFGLYSPVFYEVLIEDLIHGTSSFAGAASLRIFNDSTGVRPGVVDFYNLNDFFVNGGGSGAQPVVVNNFNINLVDSDASVFSDDRLPLFLPSLDQFEEASFRIVFGNNDSLSGTITTLAIPEPSTYVLFLAGLGLLGFMLHRRGKQATPSTAIARRG